MMAFGIIAIITGVIAILDAAFQIFARTFVQGHEVKGNPILRIVEALIGVGFIIMGIFLIVRAHH